VIDLLVVGAGPAGLATALHAARAGLDTVVVDARPTRVDKACGEGLMPGAVRALRGLGVQVDGYPIRGIRYLDGDQRASAQFRDGPGIGVRRTELHRALLREVQARGVPMLRRPVGHIRQYVGSVGAAGVSARYLAAADGLHSPIRRQLGLQRRPRRKHLPRWGLRQHFALAPWTDFVEVHWSAQAEAYVTPVGPNLVGVAILGGGRGSFTAQLAAFPALLDRLPSRGVTEVRGAGPLRQQVRRRVSGRVLLVGDAAGYVDALTGEGIALALTSAAALVDCVARDRPHDYERQWRVCSRRYRLVTETLLWAGGRPRLRRAIVPAAARAPGLFATAVHQLAR
jgi:flavin-dependent dehydrogenase